MESCIINFPGPKTFRWSSHLIVIRGLLPEFCPLDLLHALGKKFEHSHLPIKLRELVSHRIQFWMIRQIRILPDRASTIMKRGFEFRNSRFLAWNSLRVYKSRRNYICINSWDCRRRGYGKVSCMYSGLAGAIETSLIPFIGSTSRFYIEFGFSRTC